MKNLFYCTKKNVYQITKNDDGTLTFFPEEKNAGCIIMQRGGIEGFLDNCIEDNRNYKEFLSDRKLIAQKQIEYRMAMREQNANVEKETVIKSYKLMLAKYGMSVDNIDKTVAIDTTIDNLYILMRYMYNIPCFDWKLPKLSQRYSYHLYECDGKFAVTIILNEGIFSNDGKLVKKLQYGAPKGHLSQYINIGRL